MLSDESSRRSPAHIPQLDEEKTSLEAKLSTGTLSHEELMKASERIGELIEEMDPTYSAPARAGGEGGLTYPPTIYSLIT